MTVETASSSLASPEGAEAKQDNRDPQTRHKTSRLLKRLFFDYIQSYFPQLFIAIFFMLIAAACTAGLAWLMQPVLDDVLYGGREDLVWPIAGALAGIFILRGITTYIHIILMSQIGERIIGDLQRDLFQRFLSLDLSFHVNNPSGQLISRIVNDVQMVRFAITDTMSGFGKSLTTLIFLAVVMFMKDPVLAAAALTIFPLAAGFVIWLGRRLRKISKRTQEEMGDLTETLGQILQGIRLVKAYGREEYEAKRATGQISKVRSLMVKAVRIGQLSTPMNEVMVGIVVLSVIVYGSSRIFAGYMTPGDLIAFITAFTLAYEPMKKLAKLNNSLQIGLGAAERVFDMMDTPIDVIEASKPSVFKLSEPPAISFEQVSFKYQDADNPSVDNLSFEIPAGQTTALVGPSGAGKSTILNLLLRFYDPQSGSIKINDFDVRAVKFSDLRGQMAFVSQDITIFNDTVSNNISYGKPDASVSEIEEAARRAAADEFISALPAGYDTILGEDGVKLSGGQRQRISLARAILRDAPVLLLDEATSALDSETERHIQQALSDFGQNRTTIVIAHRLSTVTTAEQILVLERGQVIEHGTHAQLLKKKGLYARMVKRMKDESG